MRTRELYKRYRVMPQLETHMLRVAGVAEIVTKDWSDDETARECVAACLTHDLGNIVKFDLAHPLVPIDNLDYWQGVQREDRERYGRDAVLATQAMLTEAGLGQYADYLSEEDRTFNSPVAPDWDKISRPALLILYADLRVAPSGVVTLEQRTNDLARRYGKVRPESAWSKELEAYVQSLTTVVVKTIGEADVTPLFDKMLTLDIY